MLEYQKFIEYFKKETKYIRWYYNIVANAKLENRKKVKGPYKIYYEKHHILPASMFQEFKKLNDNKWNEVLLTAKEHFICHLLIWKHFRKINCKYEMYRAAKACTKMMYNNQNQQRYMARSYSLIKESNSLKFDNMPLDIRNEYIKKIARKGSQNGSFKNRIIIIPKLNKTIYFNEHTSNCSFTQFLKDNNLPRMLNESCINDGKPIYSTKCSLTLCITRGHQDFIGAYCLFEGNEQLKEYKNYKEVLEKSFDTERQSVIKRKETLKLKNDTDTKKYGRSLDKHHNFIKRKIIIPLLDKEIIFDENHGLPFRKFLKEHNLPKLTSCKENEKYSNAHRNLKTKEKMKDYEGCYWVKL